MTHPYPCLVVRQTTKQVLHGRDSLARSLRHTCRLRCLWGRRQLCTVATKTSEVAAKQRRCGPVSLKLSQAAADYS